MKQARQVIIPTDRPLTWDEVSDLRAHAKASSLWYATSYSRNSSQITEKLLKKGFLLETVTAFDKEGKKFTVDLIGEVLEYLKDLSVVDDKHYAESFVASKMRAGLGINRIRRELMLKGISSALIDEVMVEIEGSELNDAFEITLRRLMNASSFTRLSSEPAKQRQKLIQGLLAKGFSYSDISDKLSYIEWD